MTNAAFLKTLGYKQLAELTGATPSAVANWKERGIPWRHRRVIARMAADQMIDLPEGYWE